MAAIQLYIVRELSSFILLLRPWICCLGTAYDDIELCHKHDGRSDNGDLR